MGFVKIDFRVVTPFQIDDFTKGSPITIHTENRFGHDPRVAVIRPVFFEQSFQMLHIVMIEPFPVGFALPEPIDQAGVDQFVGQNQIAFPGNSRQYARIGHIAAPDHQNGFTVVHRREFPLQTRVVRAVSGNQSRGRVTQQKSLICSHFCHEFPVQTAARQPQIVVRRKIQIPFPLTHNISPLDLDLRQMP